jgi:hypothetical protein
MNCPTRCSGASLTVEDFRALVTMAVNRAASTISSPHVPWRGSPLAKDLNGDLSEIPQLIKSYATQELVDPMRAIGRYIGFGVIGALFIGLGIVMLGFSALRAMQVEGVDTFDGNWSVVPYLIVTVVGIVVLGLIGTRMTKGLEDD